MQSEHTHNRLLLQQLSVSCRGDIVRVTTWMQTEGRVGARRDWELTNAQTGELLGCATSSWVMFNYRTRRLGRMPDDARAAYQQLMPDPPKHVIDPSETRLRLPELAESASLTTHTASPNYMDMNNHLNNTAYLTWILDSIPDDVLSQRVLAQYEVEYKAEGVGGVHSSPEH
jgi:acyl-ACP thioesterase